MFHSFIFLNHRPSFIKHLSIFLFLVALMGCSDSSTGSNPGEKPVKEAIVVGTQVPSDFLSKGEFGLLGIPIDEQGKSILAGDVDAKVTVDSVSLKSSSYKARANSRILNDSSAASKITAEIVSKAVNKPGTDPIAVSLDIDGSASMIITDSSRTRVKGAKGFFKKLSESGLNRGYSISAFTYPGTPNKPFLKKSQLLSPFTDNIDALDDSVENVPSNGYSTPTYASLLEVLSYSEDQKPYKSNEKALVLLSDGLPTTTDLRDSVCQVANELKSPIYSIGLGPASDLSTAPLPSAVEEMRAVASCSGGSYAGIDPKNSNATASRLYQNIAVSASNGNIKYDVKLSGNGFSNLQPGSIIYFTLSLSNAKGNASVSFSFSVPRS